MMRIKKENGLFIAEYSVTGQNHILKGQANQDAMLSGCLNENLMYVALADGVSSAQYAEQGSLYAVKTIDKLVKEISLGSLDICDRKELQNKIVHYWKEQIQCNWNEYATTLNFIIYVNSFLIVGQIGDGLICLNIDGINSFITTAEDFYTMETAALSEMVYRKDFYLNIYPVKSTFSAVMMTDGIGKEIPEDSRIPLEKYLEHLSRDSVKFEKEIRLWINSLGNKNGDDKSIIYIRREEL